MRLVFRVDCNQKTGFGHLSRVINLCRTWRDSGGIKDFVFIGNYNQFALKMLNRYDLPCEELSTDDFSDLGFKNITSGDIVLIDSYLLTQSQLEQVVAMSNPLILIDDECLLDYAGVDIVINFRFNAEKLYHYNSDYSLLGIDYFIIKPELVSLRERRMDTSKDLVLKKLLLFFGGGFSDSVFISNVISHLNQLSVSTEIILLGAHENVKGRFVRLLPTPDFHKHLEHIDGLINAGGVIKYESSFSLIPTGSFSTTDLQNEDSKILKNHGVHEDFGLVENVILTENMVFDSFITDISNREWLIRNCRQMYSNSPTLNLTKRLNEIL